MKRASKHSVGKLALSPLTGGINVAVPPEQIAPNETQACDNFLFEAATLVGRGGLKKIYTFQNAIKSMYYDYDSNSSVFVLENQDAFRGTLGSGGASVYLLGKVTGDKKACCVRFQNKLFIATGGLLQYCNFQKRTATSGEIENTIYTVTKSRLCDKLFYRWGRLGCSRTGTDYVYYSAVGDAIGDSGTDVWSSDSNDDSMGRELEVGYADSGDIIEIVPLATDIIVFKSNGKAYQIVGDADFNTVSVVSISSFTDMNINFSHGTTACNIGNEVIFLSLRGLRTLSAVQDYGNIATGDIGDKFNTLLTTNLYEPEMFHCPRHKFIIIRPTASKRNFVVYNYSVKAATTISFKIDVECFCETDDSVFVCADNSVYLWTEQETTDDGEPIDYKIIPRDVASSDEILIKAIDTKFMGDHEGVANVEIDRLKVKMPTNSRRKIRCNHSTDLIHMEITSNDRFYVDHITLDTVDL